MEESNIQVDGVKSTISLQQDVLRIGTPGKGGSIDIHGVIDDVEDFMRKIDNARVILEYAREQLVVK